MLLEREDLLAVLGARLQSAANGMGTMLLVAGEAGAGKTVLIRAFVESLESSTLVIQGACDPLTTPRPLSPLHDFAADPDSGLADLSEPDRTTSEVFAAVLDRLRNTIRPVVMVIEDVHWADEGTLDFLRFLGRRVSDTRALVICTYRDDEVGADHPLRPVLGQIIPLETTRRVVVPPLSTQAVAELARDHPIDPIRLHRATGGNAFFVTEVLASGDTLPHTVQEAVLARVARLQGMPRRVVEAVSVAPRSLDIDHALDIAGGSPDDIDTALAAGVLIGDGHSLRFRHELARAAVDASLSSARRLTLHRQMLGLIADADPPDLARLAHHAFHADRPELVAEFAPRAAEEAVQRGAHREAVEFYEQALQHSANLDPDETASLRLRLGRELGVVDRQREALHQQLLAIDHFRVTGNDVSLASALISGATSHWRLNERQAGRAAIEEAISLLEPHGESQELGYAWWCQAYLSMLARQYDESLGAIDQAIAISDRMDDHTTRRLADLILGTIEIVMGDVDRGIDLLVEAHERALAASDRTNAELALEMLGSGGGEARRYEVAEDALSRCVVMATESDADYFVAYSRAWLARIAFERGRWEDAVMHAETVLAGPTEGAISPVTALGALGRTRVRRGDPGSVEALERALAIGEGCEMQHLWSPLCGLAERSWLRGRPNEVAGILDWVFGEALRADSTWARGEVGFWMWRAGAIDRPPERAAEPYALQISGDWRAAAEAWRRIGCPYEVAMALADGPEPAKLEALEILDGLGARPLADLIRRDLRDMGIGSVPRGPSKGTRANPAGLTPRQLEVLRLVAEGLSNEQIAVELYLSKKTVEHHISAIYSKLGVASRTRAITAAAEVGAVEK
jgi:DNA-binding CsgD family transcriptional regulator/tetratricopeptide (TPR) repeat protein